MLRHTRETRITLAKYLEPREGRGLEFLMNTSVILDKVLIQISRYYWTQAIVASPMNGSGIHSPLGLKHNGINDADEIFIWRWFKWICKECFSFRINKTTAGLMNELKQGKIH